jgi:DNA polymerase elongation subunit (family B)
MKIAESTTFIGREYILETKRIVEEDFARYQTKVVYGDTGKLGKTFYFYADCC